MFLDKILLGIESIFSFQVVDFLEIDEKVNIKSDLLNL
jgi:hypothetical protein